MAPVRDVINDALTSDGWKKFSSWVRGNPRRGRAAAHEIDGIGVPADVVVYFGDGAEKIYQVQQWLPVLEQLHRRHRVLLVFRRVGALRAVKQLTPLPKIFVRRFKDLMDLYDENRYRLAIYVNNGVNNFQSLNSAETVHVHVNHGESDKISMVANQVKAYDKVFVAGPAAVERHKRVLYDFDLDQLLVVGRPQLDIDFPSELQPVAGLRTVMYAPTWSGENEANNYTSVDRYGPAIVEALLAAPSVRLVYKPHPRVVDGADDGVREGHEAIVRAIEEAVASTGVDHQVRLDGNILAMFDAVDALITDVSSVGLDFLYSHPLKPMVLTDRRSDREALHEEAPVSRGCAVIDQDSVGDVAGLLRRAIREDEYGAARAEARRYYFGEVERGQSTRLFTETVDRLIAERQESVARRTAEYGSEPPSVVGE